MATHFSTLAWRIPWTEEPGRLQSMGLQRVGRDWVCMHAVTFSESQLSLFLYCPLNKILFWDSHVEDAGINSQANGAGQVHETSVCFSNIHFMALDQLKEHNQCQVVFNNPVSVKFLGWTRKKNWEKRANDCLLWLCRRPRFDLGSHPRRPSHAVQHQQETEKFALLVKCRILAIHRSL